MNKTQKKVIIAMSGGVDSSVAAALMIEADHDVLAITMRLGHHDTIDHESEKPNCCSIEGVEDARRVATNLGIPFYALNYEDQFRKSIVDYFVDEYNAGRTPSPCVVCNKDLKFGKLIDQADRLGYDYVATGHYARIEYSAELDRHLLKKGLDGKKDQSYFLFSLTQDQLRRAIMPLGSMTKDQVREIARRHGMWTAEKPESQELCFVADDNYKRFLKDRIPDQIDHGEIINEKGETLGGHDGIQFYTIGQRRGLGISAKTPLYVTEIRVGENQIVVGKVDDLLEEKMRIENVNWIAFNNLENQIRATVKIRYRDRGESAMIFPITENSAEIKFDQPCRAVTPGQAAVIYDGDLVIGGGWIAK